MTKWLISCFFLLLFLSFYSVIVMLYFWVTFFGTFFQWSLKCIYILCLSSSLCFFFLKKLAFTDMCVCLYTYSFLSDIVPTTLFSTWYFKCALLSCVVSKVWVMNTVGRFSEAGLHEWMPFVIFRARSCKRSQHRFHADFWVGIVSCCVYQCCGCKNYLWKRMEGGKKVSLHHFLADQKIASLWKKCILGHPVAEQQVTACCQTHSDYRPQKMPLKLAV